MMQIIASRSIHARAGIPLHMGSYSIFLFRLIHFDQCHPEKESQNSILEVQRFLAGHDHSIWLRAHGFSNQSRGIKHNNTTSKFMFILKF